LTINITVFWNMRCILLHTYI